MFIMKEKHLTIQPTNPPYRSKKQSWLYVLDMRLKGDECLCGKSPPAVCPLTVRCSSVLGREKQEARLLALTVYSR